MYLNITQDNINHRFFRILLKERFKVSMELKKINCFLKIFEGCLRFFFKDF